MPDKCTYLIEHLETKHRYTFSTFQPLTRGSVCDWEGACLFFLLSCLSPSVTFFLVASAAASLGSSSSASKHSQGTSSHFKVLLPRSLFTLFCFDLFFEAKLLLSAPPSPHGSCLSCVSASSLVGASGEHLSN